MTTESITILPYEEPRKINLEKIYYGVPVFFSNDPKNRDLIKDVDVIKVGDIIFTNICSNEIYAGIITEKIGPIADCTVKIENATYYCRLAFGADDRLCWSNIGITTFNRSATIIVNSV